MTKRRSAFLLVAAWSFLAAPPAYPLNPIVPGDYFGADPEGRAGTDGRMYVYGSHDTSTTTWCSNNYHVFSSADLRTWTDHGESFHSSGAHDDVPWSDALLYAPDAVFQGGMYYLYFSLSAGTDDEGVATSASPTGPFSNASIVAGASGIDPAVFIDDDGQAYLYWGQYASSAARLKSNLIEIDQTTLVTNLVTEAAHHFHEGSSLRKRNGVYYYVFADISRRGKPTCLGYATSAAPLGPFTYRGVIIDNAPADPGTWNNHGSIAEFNGGWYVLYHRAARGSEYTRKICIEPISFDADGSIPEVKMTTQGAEGPLDPFTRIEAELACELSGTTRTEPCSEGGDDLGFTLNSDYAVYRYFDFGTGATTLAARVASGASGGRIEARLESESGILIATCTVPSTGDWQTWQTVSCPVSGAMGVHTLYLRFTGGSGNLLNLNWFEFTPAVDGGAGASGTGGWSTDQDGAAAGGTTGSADGAADRPTSEPTCACRTAGSRARRQPALPGILLAAIGGLARRRRGRGGSCRAVIRA